MSESEIKKIFEKLEAISISHARMEERLIAHMDHEERQLDDMNNDINRAHGRIDTLRNIGGILATGITSIGAALGIAHK